MAKILIVDDEYAIVDTIMDVLSVEGYDCKSATNGREGLDAVRTERPDLIIIDLMMPVMDGREALNALAADPVLASIPAILMSAAPREVATAGVEHRNVAFIRKPFDLNRFLTAVASKLGEPS
jgi:CheY-like chemotaxis protein